MENVSQAASSWMAEGHFSSEEWENDYCKRGKGKENTMHGMFSVWPCLGNSTFES